MIGNDEHLAIVLERIAKLECALEQMRRDPATHPSKLRLMSEPFLEDISRMKAAIEQYDSQRNHKRDRQQDSAG